MGRIAGLMMPSTDPEAAGRLDAMLAAARSRPGWQTWRETLGHAAFGWCGWDGVEAAAVGRVIIVMDGRIYNRSELGSAGTDAELVARLHATHGFRTTLERLNGDFAVALYDGDDGALWLGRDRFGIRPLYYAAGEHGIAFASRPRALLTLPWVPDEANRQFVALFAASHYRTFDNEPAASPFAGIAQLPAGHFLRATAATVATFRYWTLHDLPDFTESEEELAVRYRELLLDAVGRRVRGAGRPAFTLSGGMDSSSVLAAAVHALGSRQHAFSSVYEDKTFDETDEIRSMLDAAVAQWHPVAIGQPDVFALVREMIEVHDEPVATATWLSHFLLCREVAAGGFAALFGGLGGDELNAGEYEYFPFFFADLRAQGQEALLRHETERWIAHHDHPLFRKSPEVMRDALSRLVDPTRPGVCLPDDKRLRRYYSVLNPEYFTLEDFRPAMDHPFRSYLANRTFQDLFRETLPCCLRAQDRQATRFELDHVTPFLDHRLVEFMFRVPATMKIRAGVTKHLLRLATRGLLPDATRTRIKKTGWNAPAHVWFSGAGRQALHDLVASQRFRERGVYDVDRVRQLIDDHERIVASGRPEENHMMFLWQLVNLESWFQWLEGWRAEKRPA